MGTSKIRDDVERWMVHKGLTFQEIKNPENTFHILAKHAGEFGVSIEVFEPKSQLGILVVGAKVVMNNRQIARYLGFNKQEKEQFEKRTAEYCHSIQAVNRFITEDGKQKIGVYVVLDDKQNINQTAMFDAMELVSEKYEKTAQFLLKTF